LDGGNFWEVIMKIQFKILFVLLSVALNVAFVGGWVTRAFRAPEEKAGFQSLGGTPGAMPVLYQQLGATEQQWQQLRPQFEAFRESALAVFTRINQRRQELLSLLADSQADRASISEKQKEIRAAQAQMQDLVISHVLAERELLTSAQRQRYFELLAQRSGMLCENLMEGLRPVTTGGDSRPPAPPAKQ
jgi:Spy/CpxP family protein refolding chaperone